MIELHMRPESPRFGSRIERVVIGGVTIPNIRDLTLIGGSLDDPIMTLRLDLYIADGDLTVVHADGARITKGAAVAALTRRIVL